MRHVPATCSIALRLLGVGVWGDFTFVSEDRRQGQEDSTVTIVSSQVKPVPECRFRGTWAGLFANTYLWSTYEGGLRCEAGYG
jgi:hypothetical protein